MMIIIIIIIPSLTLFLGFSYLFKPRQDARHLLKKYEAQNTDLPSIPVSWCMAM
jgi:hypothetical protein